MAASLSLFLPKFVRMNSCHLRSVYCLRHSYQLANKHNNILKRYVKQNFKTNFFDIARRHTTGTTHRDRKCWKCKTATDSNKELFFCNCGVVQAVPNDLNYFQAMQFEERFEIDIKRLSQLHKELQWKLHPDKFSQSSEEEQQLAEAQSAFINKAYNTLLKPLSRGQYLLELLGDPIEEANTDVDPDFLVEIMEVNEDIAEADDNIDSIRRLDDINGARMEKCITKISKAFAENDIPAAKKQLVKLRYFSNVDDKIKAIYRKAMDQ